MLTPRQRREQIEALSGVWVGIPGLSTKDLETERREEREREERRLLGDHPGEVDLRRSPAR
jgi:hypothetical protein